MAASHDQLPRDVNGIIQGAYRILHEDPTYHGEVGVFEIREGSSTVPACGRALQCALGEYGSRLFLEPWGPLPDGFLMPELIAPEVSPEVAAAFERCPWRETADAAKADEA